MIRQLDIPFDRKPINCYSSRGTPFARWVPAGMPKLGNTKKILDIVFFLYPSVEAAEAGRHFVYGVTNWHVAVRDGSSVVRLNTHDGGTEIFDFGPEDWQFLPSGPDIAVLRSHFLEAKKGAVLTGGAHTRYLLGIHWAWYSLGLVFIGGNFPKNGN